MSSQLPHISPAVLLLVVLAPLGGAILAGLFGRVIGRTGAHTVTILGVAASFMASAQVLYQLNAGLVDPFNQNVYTFFEVGRYSAHVGFTDPWRPGTRVGPCGGKSREAGAGSGFAQARRGSQAVKAQR